MSKSSYAYNVSHVDSNLQSTFANTAREDRRPHRETLPQSCSLRIPCSLRVSFRVYHKLKEGHQNSELSVLFANARAPLMSSSSGTRPRLCRWAIAADTFTMSAVIRSRSRWMCSNMSMALVAAIPEISAGGAHHSLPLPRGLWNRAQVEIDVSAPLFELRCT